jgi:hypothetical protein
MSSTNLVSLYAMPDERYKSYTTTTGFLKLLDDLASNVSIWCTKLGHSTTEYALMSHTACIYTTHKFHIFFKMPAVIFMLFHLLASTAEVQYKVSKKRIHNLDANSPHRNRERKSDTIFYKK